MSQDGEKPHSCALISGTGVTGRACAIKCASLSGWKVITLARRREQDIPELAHNPRVLHIQTDLSKSMGSGSLAEALKRSNALSGDVPTYIFHCAYTETGDPVKDCEVNKTMLQNLVEGCESSEATLKHVFTMEGSKWYGQHFSAALKTPFSEQDSRHLPPNFYYNLEDYLKHRVESGASWTWSALRPGPVFGFSTGSYMNITVSIAVYASICKELGIDLRFPGSLQAYESLWDGVDGEVLADAMVFTSTNEKAANQAFNINNGDVFRWKHIFQVLADWFDMPLGPPIQMSLVKQMADKKEVWEAMVKKHGLQDVPWDKLVTFKFVDFIFSQPADSFSNCTKLKQAGFDGMKVDTAEMFRKQLQHLRDSKVIP